MVELEARVLELEQARKDIGELFFIVGGHTTELAKLRELVMDAIAQAQDAHNTSSGFDARLNTLTLAVAEGIQHVERAESRIRGVVARARRELRDGGLESPGLEAEAHQLSLIHGGAGEGEGVPPVPEVMASPEADPLLDRLRAIGLSR